MNIRKATSDEWAKVADIYSREGLSDEVLLVSKEVLSEFKDIDSGVRVIWFAEQDGLVVGTIQLVLTSIDKPNLANGSDRAMIHHLRVSKNFENMGVSSALYHTLENEAKSCGYDEITLEVEKKNERAKSIYSHWGFRLQNDTIGNEDIVLIKKISY